MFGHNQSSAVSFPTDSERPQYCFVVCSQKKVVVESKKRVVLFAAGTIEQVALDLYYEIGDL